MNTPSLEGLKKEVDTELPVMFVQDCTLEIKSLIDHAYSLGKEEEAANARIRFATHSEYNAGLTRAAEIAREEVAKAIEAERKSV